jgi:hypothetical protein
MNNDENDLNQLEEEKKKYKEEKNLVECMSTLEKILNIKAIKFGKHSPEVNNTIKY